MIPSGIAPLDDRLGGLLPKRTYVLTGAPGTGKTIACLEFLSAAFDAGEHAVLLTSDDPTDLVAQGEFLGIDLERQLADEKLILLRYQLDFTRRFARTALPELVFDELRALIGDKMPARIAIDSVAPFLEASTASGAGLRAMVNFLDAFGATSLVTYPADLAGLYDRRLEPLVQRAAAILHFTCDRDRGYRMELRKVRFAVSSTAPLAFTIQPGVGLASVADGQRRRSNDTQPENANKVLVIDTAGAFPEDLLAGLRSQYDVTLRSTVTSAFGDLASGSGAVLLEVQRDTVEDALTLVRELRRNGSSAPIALITQFTLRADDRARALRAGADEFISGELHPSEFIARLEAAIERGHAARPVAEVEVPIVTQPSADGKTFELLDAHGFRNAVSAHMAGDHVPFFTVVTLRPRGGGGELQLGDVVLDALRIESGDLAGYLERGIAVYLHSARRKDVHPFVERVREEWRRAGHGELDVAVAAYPAEEDQVIDLLSAEPRDVALRLVPNAAGTALRADAAPVHEAADELAPLLLVQEAEREAERQEQLPARPTVLDEDAPRAESA